VNWAELLIWNTARATGILAYLLVTASVALGLLLSLKVRSDHWPRFVTNELHRFVTLLALVFTGLHTAEIWIDPYTHFTPAEVLVPLVSHYRPLWVAVGIVASYLLIGFWISEWLRPRIGYTTWRRLHYLTFFVWILATAHGLGAGSDTRTVWAVALYALSSALVGVLLAWRLAEAAPGLGRTVAGIGASSTGLALAIWALAGPLQPGWSGPSTTAGLAPVVPAATTPSMGPGSLPASFSASLSGALSVDQTTTVPVLQISGHLTGGIAGTMAISLPGDDDLAAVGSALRIVTDNGTTCSGAISGISRRTIVGWCRDGSGTLHLLRLRVTATGSSLQGTLVGTTRASAGSAGGFSGGDGGFPAEEPGEHEGPDEGEGT